MTATLAKLPAAEATFSLPVPHDIELEQTILGTVLMSNRNMDRCNEIEPSDFYEPLHGVIFEAMRYQWHKTEAVNVLTLKAALGHLPDVTEKLPVVDYLRRLLTVGDASNFPALVKMQIEFAKRRKAIVIAEELAAAAQTDEAADLLIEHAEAQLYALKKQGPNAKTVKTLSLVMSEALDAVSEAYKRGTGLSGLSSGIKGLDDVIGGFANSGLYVIAGRPAMGKSALAMNIAYNVATSSTPVPVGVMSLEMSGAEIGQRIIAERTGIPGWALRKGDIRSDDQWRTLVDVVGKHKPVPFYIDETGGVSIAQLTMRARRMASRYGIGLLVVDYLQLVHGSNTRNGNRVQEVTEITVALKALAKELSIPIIALSQLSRAVESRDNKRPQLSDLRESGSIEQDADCVAFVYRPQYYTEREKPEENSAAYLEWQDAMRKQDGLAEVIVGKNRHGPTGTAELAFNAITISFSDKE